jgi:hypothetical protein
MLKQLLQPFHRLAEHRRDLQRERQRQLREQRREIQGQDPERTIEKLVQSALVDQKQRPY